MARVVAAAAGSQARISSASIPAQLSTFDSTVLQPLWSALATFFLAVTAVTGMSWSAALLESAAAVP
jgi:hypothetical protein